MTTKPASDPWNEIASKGTAIVIEGPGPSDKVQNGHVYEVGRVALATNIRRLVVPTHARVRSGPDGVLTIATDKGLAFKGHPPQKITLENVRANMGVATKIDGDALLVASFGEWDSKEGGAALVISIVTPPGLRVERRDDLDDRGSIANKGTAPPKGHWYGGSSPTPGWQQVPVDLDPKRLADEK